MSGRGWPTARAKDINRSGHWGQDSQSYLKSDAPTEFVTDIFNKLSTISHSGSKGRPHFICIRTQAEAQQYETRSLQLWPKCTANTRPRGLLSRKFYFLGPRFFTLNNVIQVARSELCLAVQVNQIDHQGLKFIPTKAMVITGFLIKLVFLLAPCQDKALLPGSVLL